MKNLFSRRSLIAALILSLGLAGGSYAMLKGDHSASGKDMRAYHSAAGGHETMNLNRLRDELKLNDKQLALWADADKFAKETREAGHDRARTQHEAIKSLFDQPGADLRSIAKRMDEAQTEHFKQKSAVRERWLTAYDSLSAEQKEKARLYFKDEAGGKEHASKDGANEHGGRGDHSGKSADHADGGDHARDGAKHGDSSHDARGHALASWFGH